MTCKICNDSGMTGWEKPMGFPPKMVFVPQRCQCSLTTKENNMAEVQSLGGTSRIIWRAAFVKAIAWCLGVSGHVILRAVR